MLWGKFTEQTELNLTRTELRVKNKRISRFAIATKISRKNESYFSGLVWSICPMEDHNVERSRISPEIQIKEV